MININKVNSILCEYVQKNSMIDSGNLFYAATEYRSAYDSLKKQNDIMREALTNIKNNRYGELDGCWGVSMQALNEIKDLGE